MIEVSISENKMTEVFGMNYPDISFGRMILWAEENGGKFIILISCKYDKVTFENEADAIVFKLKYGL